MKMYNRAVGPQDTIECKIELLRNIYECNVGQKFPHEIMWDGNNIVGWEKTVWRNA